MSGMMAKHYAVCDECGIDGPRVKHPTKALIAAYRKGWLVDGVLKFCPTCADKLTAERRGMQQVEAIRRLFRETIMRARAGRIGRKARETA